MLFIMKTKHSILRENALREKVLEFLVESGFDVKGGLRVKGRIPDIVAVRNDRIVMVEVKGSMGRIVGGISRAIDYTSGAHFSYLAIPAARSSGKLRQTIKNLDLGLIEVNDEVTIAVEPEKKEPLESIKRRLLGMPRKKIERRAVPLRHATLAKISKHRDIVKLLLKYPARSFTVRELSRLSGTPYSTAWRFIKELYSAGVVITERIGPSISCSLNRETPFLAEVEKIVEIEISPHILAAEEFTKKARKLRGVKKIILFGSAARGEEKLTSDVDIAVIVKNKGAGNEINRIAGGILNRARIKIIPMVISWKEVEKNEQFKKALEEGEILYERGK